MKQTMNVSMQVFLSRTMNGLAWALVGIFGFWNNKFGDIMQFVFLTISIVCLFFVTFARKQISDEMSEYHLVHAKATTQTIMHVVFGMAMIVMMLVSKRAINIAVDFSTILVSSFFILIGIDDFLVGFLFKM